MFRSSYILASFVAFSIVSIAAPAVAQPVRIKTAGTVRGVGPGFIYMQNEQAEKYAVKIPTDKKVLSVKGRLNPDQIRPGMIVRFNGTLRSAAVEDELAEITVYTPADGYAPGIIADDPESPALVTGRVQSYKSGTLIVMAGKTRITAKVAESVAVNVDTGDHTVVPPGARIEVSGYLTKSSGQISPQKATVVLPDPPDAETGQNQAPKKRLPGR